MLVPSCDMLVPSHDMLVTSSHLGSVLQVFMACAFIILVGVLILKGNWYEKIFDHKKTPLPQLLLHYSSITTPQVQQIEHSYATQLKKEDPTTAHVVEIRDTAT